MMKRAMVIATVGAFHLPHLAFAAGSAFLAPAPVPSLNSTVGHCCYHSECGSKCVVLHDACSSSQHLCETSGFCDGSWCEGPDEDLTFAASSEILAPAPVPSLNSTVGHCCYHSECGSKCVVLHDACSSSQHLCETSGFCDGSWCEGPAEDLTFAASSEILAPAPVPSLNSTVGHCCFRSECGSKCVVLHDDCSSSQHLCETSGFCGGSWCEGPAENLTFVASSEILAPAPVPSLNSTVGHCCQHSECGSQCVVLHDACSSSQHLCETSGFCDGSWCEGPAEDLTFAVSSEILAPAPVPSLNSTVGHCCFRSECGSKCVVLHDDCSSSQHLCETSGFCRGSWCEGPAEDLTFAASSEILAPASVPSLNSTVGHCCFRSECGSKCDVLHDDCSSSQHLCETSGFCRGSWCEGP